jgi:uncharacterized repeat protein (TIGR03803 family)
MEIMMLLRNRVAVLTLAAMLPAAASLAKQPTFSIIATVAKGPVIGAWHAGTLYGTTPAGGSYSNGTLFQISAEGTPATLQNFLSKYTGATPSGRLAVDPSGNVYGTTNTGGANGGGTVWKYAASGGLTTLHAFGAAGDGASPLQGPVIAKSLTLYGSTSGGAVNTNGMVWSLSASGVYTALHNFLSGTDGHCPFSGVAHGKGNVIYGTTVGMGYGGDSDGSVWKIVPGQPLATLYKFLDGADGEYPDQSPTVDSAGNIYGTTHIQNAAAFAGAIWKITPAGSFSVLHSLVSGTDGFAPNSPLLLDFNGNLYGTTSSGGQYGHGTVFRITPSGDFTVLHAFTNGTDGGSPTGNLARDKDGFMYGGTATGQIYKLHD